MKIPLSAPDITETDIEAVVSVLRTPWLSIGPKMVEFEESVARFVGAPHAVAVALRGCKLASGASELLKQKGPKARVWFADINRLDQLFSVEKHNLWSSIRGVQRFE